MNACEVISQQSQCLAIQASDLETAAMELDLACMGQGQPDQEALCEAIDRIGVIIGKLQASKAALEALKT